MVWISVYRVLGILSFVYVHVRDKRNGVFCNKVFFVLFLDLPIITIHYNTFHETKIRVNNKIDDTRNYKN